MKIGRPKIYTSITKGYIFPVTIRNKKYFLYFQVIDGEVPDFKMVATAQLEYFNFTERTRKAHFKEIIKKITK